MPRPKKPPPPDGWRYLRSGERVQPGDRAASKDGGGWHPVERFETFSTASRNLIRWYARKKKERKS